jgi:hypothetical protein
VCCVSFESSIAQARAAAGVGVVSGRLAAAGEAAYKYAA